MKNKQFIVQQCSIRKGLANNLVEEKAWVATKDSLAEAKSMAESLSENPGIVSVAVIMWEPGNANRSYRLVHGSYASRNTGGGIPVETLVMMGRRTLAWRGDSRSSWADASGLVWQVLMDWDWESVDGVTKLDMSPRKPTGRLKTFMLEDRPDHVFFAPKDGDEALVDQVVNARKHPGTGTWSSK